MRRRDATDELTSPENCRNDLARRRDGGLRPAGSVSLGLHAERRALLLDALSDRELPGRARRGVRRTAPLVEVSADLHGPVDGQVRDAVLREIRLARSRAQHDAAS